MIPLSIPALNGNEWNYIKDCLDTNWVSSVGSYVNKFEEVTAQFTGSKFAIATSNGTAALHIALKLVGVEAGDLVIAPNITFVASINAIKYCNANPILIDINPETWQMDLDLVEKFLENDTYQNENQCFETKTKARIKAIMPVHVLGNMCDMDRLMEISKKYNLEVVEDSTEALGSYFKSKHAGTFGKIGTLSYNGNKIITTGGGGMILTDDENIAKKAKHLTTQAKASGSEYFHDEVGYNYRLVNILAAIGVAQMEQLPAILIRKKEITEFYKSKLSQFTKLQKVDIQVKPNNWLFTIKVNNQSGLLKYLNENKIEARPFWVPMNQLPANTSDRYYYENDFSNEIYKSCISLPCSASITDADIEIVCDLITQFYGI